MSLGFQRRHPGGMAENSPAFQRWDLGPGMPSPEEYQIWCKFFLQNSFETKFEPLS